VVFGWGERFTFSLSLVGFYEQDGGKLWFFIDKISVINPLRRGKIKFYCRIITERKATIALCFGLDFIVTFKFSSIMHHQFLYLLPASSVFKLLSVLIFYYMFGHLSYLKYINHSKKWERIGGHRSLHSFFYLRGIYTPKNKHKRL
jgi:hypothetical protein